MQNYVMMDSLTPQEKLRVSKQASEPIRKILLWGKDSEQNICLIILFGKHKFEKAVRTSSNYYWNDASLLTPCVTYSHYAVFHGVGEHLPSIPNIYYSDKKSEKGSLLCYRRGYNTAKTDWRYNSQARCYIQYFEVDEKYIVKEFYKLKKEVILDYFEPHDYEYYTDYMKQNNICFEGISLIENASDVIGLQKDSPYYNDVVNLFLQQRLYARIKYLKKFVQSAPSLEDYQKILHSASVEIACGIFQELAFEKNPVLLEEAKQITKSKTLWDKKEYHSGLIRFANQYISMFDEKLIQKQKQFIYDTLPEMDFHIKQLKIYYSSTAMKGAVLQEYMQRRGPAMVYSDLVYRGVYGKQKLYDKSTYNNGTNIKNIAFKNTIQMVKAYDMADAVGKIAYYLDAPRTKYYLRGSGRESAFNYYQRYIRRILDHYRANDEQKFIEAIKAMLPGYTKDDETYSWYYYGSGFFFLDRYCMLDDNKKQPTIWDNHIDDILFLAKNAHIVPVHDFCCKVLKKVDKQQKLNDLDIQELIVLSQIDYEKTAKLFSGKLLPKLKQLQEFDSRIMTALMNSKTEMLQKAAKTYFIKTNGSFAPEDIVDIMCLDTAEKWQDIIERNISAFHAEEYIAFIHALIQRRAEIMEKNIVFSESIIEMLQNSIQKLDTATTAQKQRVFQNFVSLLLENAEMPEFLYDMTENVVFYLDYDELKPLLYDIDLEHAALNQKYHDIVVLLECMKFDSIPKDTTIMSILELGSPSTVKMLTQLLEHSKNEIKETTTLLLLFECNVFALNNVAKEIFEAISDEKQKEDFHKILLDSPVDRAYEYALQKLDDWYAEKLPPQFVSRMLEHTCITVKKYVSDKIQNVFSHLKENPDLYLYYVKTLLYLPNKASKNKQHIYNTMPEFLSYHPQKRAEIEQILLDIGSTNVKIQSEMALVALARIQKEAMGS